MSKRDYVQQINKLILSEKDESMEFWLHYVHCFLTVSLQFSEQLKFLFDKKTI
jgi:hypothetical protein